MKEAHLDLIVERLRRYTELAPGLTDGEVEEIETRYGFRFPPDFRGLMQRALPVSNGWIDWRNASEESIRERLARPADGICFDVEHNRFWRSDWGTRSPDLQTALQVARDRIAEAPVLIPIESRYFPTEPCVAGNPILSVHQTDIIHYGYDLLSFFVGYSESEFTEEDRLPQIPQQPRQSPRPIRFWSDFIQS